MQKIVVVGMGYVGIPVAVEFATLENFEVVGLNRSAGKVDLINKGISPIENEPRLDALLKKVVSEKKLRATQNFANCKNAYAILICTETPFDEQRREPNYSSLEDALQKVAVNLTKGTLVIVESTIAPTTMDRVAIPILEEYSGLTAGNDFYIAHCPERVMPGKLLYNIENLDRVVGGINEESTKKAIALYKNITKGNLYPTDCLTAEVVKTTENSYRDVQIAFANELAMLCEKIGVDVYKVRELVNKCPYRNMHLPGAGVGGHCLPKDSLLLAYSTKSVYYPRLIMTARNINKRMPMHMVKLVENALLKKDRKKFKFLKITILGLSYLENSDDTRNSPAYDIISALKKKGAIVVVHDPYARDENMEIERNLNKALLDSDCLILVTAHHQYKNLDLEKVKKIMKTAIIIDGRNVFDKKKAEKLGFIYLGVGKVALT